MHLLPPRLFFFRTAFERHHGKKSTSHSVHSTETSTSNSDCLVFRGLSGAVVQPVRACLAPFGNRFVRTIITQARIV